MTYHTFSVRDVAGRVHQVNLSDDRRGVAMDALPPGMRRPGARDQADLPEQIDSKMAMAVLHEVCERLSDPNDRKEFLNGAFEYLSSLTPGEYEDTGNGNGMDARRNGRDWSSPMPRPKDSAASGPASFRGMPRTGASDSRITMDDKLRSFAERHPDIWRNMSRVKTYGY
jgi:hypothetical protein